MAHAPMPGLRERKRLRTREAIARAALDLFDRQGFAETTIPQIAEAADVSPRTVSAYFPRKEELALPDSEEAFATLHARLHGRPPEESAADALRAWIGGWLERQAEQEDELRVRRRVIRSHEGLRAYEHRFMLRAQDALAEAIRARPRRVARRPGAAHGGGRHARRVRRAGTRTTSPPAGRRGRTRSSSWTARWPSSAPGSARCASGDPGP